MMDVVLHRLTTLVKNEVSDAKNKTLDAILDDLKLQWEESLIDAGYMDPKKLQSFDPTITNLNAKGALLF
jgi:hypothetical protein